MMNVPELFSTISRLKAFARPLHARTENRTLVRITALSSRKTQSSFVKNEDGFIKESALLFKKTSSSFFRARSKSSTICLSPSFPQSSSVRRWCKKRDRTRCRCCSAHREHTTTVSSRDVYCYARINIYINKYMSVPLSLLHFSNKVLSLLRLGAFARACVVWSV